MGLRSPEIRGIARSDLDLDAGTVTIRYQISGSGRKAVRVGLKDPRVGFHDLAQGPERDPLAVRQAASLALHIEVTGAERWLRGSTDRRVLRCGPLAGSAPLGVARAVDDSLPLMPRREPASPSGGDP